MKFSIQHLLLLGPLFILNTILISVIALSPLRTYRYQHEVNGVQSAQDWIEISLRHCSYQNMTVADETINEWLAHRLPSIDPAYAILMDPPRLDSWGNPFRIQLRKSTDADVRLYSTGRDGYSQTDGNDSDDIRSWDENCGSWYRSWQNRRETWYCMLLSAIVTPITFWFFTFLMGVGKLRTPPKTSGG